MANKIAKILIFEHKHASPPHSPRSSPAKIFPSSQTIGQHLYPLLICSAGKQAGNTCIGYLFIYLLVCSRVDLTYLGESTSVQGNRLQRRGIDFSVGESACRRKDLQAKRPTRSTLVESIPPTFSRPIKGVSLMHLLRFALDRVGRGWFKRNAHEHAAFTAFRAMRDACTCVYHIVALVELSTPLLFF